MSYLIFRNCTKFNQTTFKIVRKALLIQFRHDWEGAKEGWRRSLVGGAGSKWRNSDSILFLLLIDIKVYFRVHFSEQLYCLWLLYGRCLDISRLDKGRMEEIQLIALAMNHNYTN